MLHSHSFDALNEHVSRTTAASYHPTHTNQTSSSHSLPIQCHDPLLATSPKDAFHLPRCYHHLTNEDYFQIRSCSPSVSSDDQQHDTTAPYSHHTQTTGTIESH